MVCQKCFSKLSLPSHLAIVNDLFPVDQKEIYLNLVDQKEFLQIINSNLGDKDEKTFLLWNFLRAKSPLSPVEIVDLVTAVPEEEQYTWVWSVLALFVSADNQAIINSLIETFKQATKLEKCLSLLAFVADFVDWQTFNELLIFFVQEKKFSDQSDSLLIFLD